MFGGPDRDRTDDLFHAIIDRFINPLYLQGPGRSKSSVDATETGSCSHDVPRIGHSVPTSPGSSSDAFTDLEHIFDGPMPALATTTVTHLCKSRLWVLCFALLHSCVDDPVLRQAQQWQFQSDLAMQVTALKSANMTALAIDLCDFDGATVVYFAVLHYSRLKRNL